MRLIDADSLQRRICGAKCGCEYEDCGNEGDCGYDHFISNATTIDAVPVVRCEKCVHYEMGVCLKIYDDGAASRYAWQERKPDDFCSHGERKGGAD